MFFHSTVRVRTDDGTALKVFENSLTTEGTPAFVFKVCYLPYSQELATCNENQTVTIFSLDTLQMKESITVPGTPWKVSQVPNGDVLIACDQAGTSRQGHYLLFSRIFEHSAEGKGDTQMLNNFAEYCKPPKKEADSGTGGGGSGEPNIKSWGHYDTRSQVSLAYVHVLFGGKYCMVFYFLLVVDFHISRSLGRRMENTVFSTKMMEVYGRVCGPHLLVSG